MTRTVTYDEVKQTLEEIAAERPDAKNPRGGAHDGCVYTDAYGDHCVAGEALVRLGLPVPDRSDPRNQRSISNIIEGGQYEPFFEGIADFEQDAVRLLAHAQDRADNAAAWGEAIGAALTLVTY